MSESTTSTKASAGPRSGHLKRDVGIVSLLFAGVGSIIGSGWLFGAMNAAKIAGPSSVLSWAIGTVMILLIGLCFSELGPMIPVSGGVVRFPHFSFGSFTSYTMGWITWIAAATVAPIEVEGALQYATKWAPLTTAHSNGAHTLTGLGYLIAVLAMALFVVINYYGVRWFARLNNILVTWKLLIIVLVVVAFLLTAFHGHNFNATEYGKGGGFMPGGAKGIFSCIATAGITFSFLGFRQGIELAGETNNPKRNIPIAIIGSVLICGVIYVLLEVAFIGAVPGKNLAASHGWLDLNYANDFGPLAALSTILGLGWLATLLYVDAVISPGDTGLIYTTVTARVSYAMGMNRNAPRSLAKTTSKGAPLVSLIVTFVIGLIVFLPFPSWQQLVGFITSATVMSFGVGPIVLMALRQQAPDAPRPFRLPAAPVISFLAFYSSNLIVFWAGWDTDWKLMVSILLGLVVLGIYYVTSKEEKPKLDFRTGAWVLVWLPLVTIQSWLSEFGGTGKISLGVGFVTNLVISGLVFWLALRFKLPASEALAHLEEARREADHSDEAEEPLPAA
ncbi:amino acid permease [Mangrovactinospora gilvigrisea]|uniref:Amino acid permease n=1 Tax=Mangrovactinospora gilvigrisea TaxID=1428644 RepID=A0A1J7B9X7_9ACTN|nr:APC family permease [Mangrovactinospora gilvigrisea]OIV35414.1 amino acid permease [Mangrovactinospora gilvigrisea]